MSPRATVGTVVACVAGACVLVVVHAGVSRVGARLALGRAAASGDPTGTARSQAGAARSHAPEVLAPDELFARAAPAVALIEVRDSSMRPMGLGSGFFVSSDGVLVTNHHVVQNASFATVRTADGQTLFVDSILSVDTESDLALLKVRGKGLPHLQLSDGQLPPTGTRVFAIGNPQGLSNTLSDGLVSGVRRDETGLDVIQTTAAISPGSSGGPLLTADVVVVGVTTFQSKSGQNLNFAVPAGRVHPLLKSDGPPRVLASAAAFSAESLDAQVLRDALVALDRGRADRAADLLKGMELRQLSNPMFWYARGYVHQRQGQYEPAADAFRKAVRLREEFPEAYMRLGEALERVGRFKESLAAYQAAARLMPDDPLPLGRVASVYVESGDYAQAVAAFDTAIAVAPRDPVLHFYKGGCLMRLKRFAEAEAAANAAVRINHRYAPGFVLKGEALMAMNRTVEAMTAFQGALFIEPKNAAVYFQLGDAAHRSGNIPAARTAWANASRYGRNSAPGAQARQRLAALGAE